MNDGPWLDVDGTLREGKDGIEAIVWSAVQAHDGDDLVRALLKAAREPDSPLRDHITTSVQQAAFRRWRYEVDGLMRWLGYPSGMRPYTRG